MATTTSRKVALIMGVANKRSIAWACVQSFLKADFDCVLTYQSDRFASAIGKLTEHNPRLLSSLACNVETEIPQLFQNQLPEILKDRKIDAIVHSIAYANFEKTTLGQASWNAYQQAQHISAYSFLETAQHASNTEILSSEASLTALSYLGAVRAIPYYHIMGPAKAALESLVRGLSIEYGPPLRVNAVSAGPLNTLAARGIPHFSRLQQHTANHSPLGRSVTAQEVADTVYFLATTGTGITGQTIYVDGGYNTIVPIAVDE